MKQRETIVPKCENKESHNKNLQDSTFQMSCHFFFLFLLLQYMVACYTYQYNVKWWGGFLQHTWQIYSIQLEAICKVRNELSVIQWFIFHTFSGYYFHIFHLFISFTTPWGKTNENYLKVPDWIFKKLNTLLPFATRWMNVQKISLK